MQRRRLPIVALADDNEELRDLLANGLRQEGYDVVEAADGRALLELALSRAPDFVITDFEMPVMNGMDVLRALRDHPDIRVILITGSPLFELDAEARALGALAVISKPFEMETLTRVLKQPRRLDRARRSLRSAASVR